ncbi:MAG: ABC transporter permease [Acidobacteria bacterium]|nr:ABC transporter permease [Candidatus Sulfomarinibacter sp. MAG AM1]
MTGFGSFFRQLARDLWSQKLRTFLTTFGIIWGTVAVSLLLAFGHGLHRQMIKSVAGLGDRIVIAWPTRTSMVYEGLGKGRRMRMMEEDIQFLKAQVELIDGISSEYSDSLIARYGERQRSVSVSGVSPAYGTMRNMIPAVGGRFINNLDVEKRRRVVFVGNELAEDLLGTLDAVGETVMIHGSPFLVVGVLVPKEQDSAYSGRDHSKMIIPESTFRALTGDKYVNNFIYKAPSPELNEVLNDQVRAALSSRLRFHPDDDQAVQLWDTTEMFVFMDAFMLGFQIFLGIMGVLTLVVGGIGVSNIMNVVVEERTREIGIKMALGARSRAILTQFMLETMILTAVGGGIGLAISFAICSAFPVHLEEYVGLPTLSPRLAVLTASILGLVGFVAGYFPARDASHLDPVVAMKL